MRITHPAVMALTALAVLEDREVVGLPHSAPEPKAEKRPPSLHREAYPSRQARRAATKPWKARP